MPEFYIAPCARLYLVYKGFTLQENNKAELN